MGVSAVASKPLGVPPRPIHFEMHLSTINDKSYDHRKIIEAGLAPSNITLGNGELKPMSKALVPRHVGSVVLAKNGFKLCYDVIAFNYIAIHLFECMSAAYFYAFKDDPEAWTNLLREADGTDVDINNQVSSCAGSTPQPHGNKRQSSASGGGEPKKQRSNDDQDQDKNPDNGNNHNNTGDDHGKGGGSGGNNNIQKPNKDQSPKDNLACPFQKLFPGRFPECEQRLLTSWDRVYQHLKRHHLLKKSYCPRCRKSFEEDDDLRDVHIQRGDCQKTTAKETGLLLTAEYNKLKNLGRGTDEDKYKEAWGRLFPGEPCPKSFVLETQLEMLKRKLEMRERELETLKRKLEMLEHKAPDVLDGFPEFDGISAARKKDISRAFFQQGSAPIPDPTPSAPTQTPGPDLTSSSEPSWQDMGTTLADGQAMGQPSHGQMPYFINPAMMAQFRALQAPHHVTSYDATPSYPAPYQSDLYPFSAPASSDPQGPPGMSTGSIAGTPTMPSQVQMNPQARMNPYAPMLSQVGHGQPFNGAGSIPPYNSDSMTGRDIQASTEMPAPMNSTFGSFPQSPGGQNLISQGQPSYLDLLPQAWSGSMQATADSSALDNLGSEDSFSDVFDFGASEGHDELDHSSG
ncbi:hypothetical protein Neosp_011760 [[Neocosmospora] mangrovei]